MCSQEELQEIFDHDSNKVVSTSSAGDLKMEQAWQQLTKSCYVNRCSAEGTKVCVQKWGSRECVCKDGFVSQDCSQDRNECETNPCKGDHQVCTNSHGSYSCGCESGYVMENDVCVDARTCEENDCGENMECKDQEHGYTCECLNGFAQAGASNSEGCVDINECDEEQVCGENQDCTNTIGGYECSCSQDYKEEGDVCVYSPCDFKTCGENSTCDKLDGNCVCNTGFKKANETCIDVDECVEGLLGLGGANPCSEDQQCVNTAGSFECIDKMNAVTEPEIVLAPEFSGTEPPVVETTEELTTTVIATTTTEPPAPKPQGRCSVDVDECQVNNGGCSAMCMNYFCHHWCYEDIPQEKAACHHDSISTEVTSDNQKGYQCVCFNDNSNVYKLCEDEFTCVIQDGKSDWVNGNFVYPGKTSCNGDGEIGIDGACYKVSEEKLSYSGAISACEEKGGSLVKLNSRKVWWVMGNHVDNGLASFWVDASSSKSLSMNTFGVGDGLLANPANDMNNVPPQMDFVDEDELHKFVCRV